MIVVTQCSQFIANILKVYDNIHFQFFLKKYFSGFVALFVNFKFSLIIEQYHAFICYSKITVTLDFMS